MDDDRRQDPSALNREVQEIWNQNAAFWDEKMGEGNQFSWVNFREIPPALVARMRLRR